jgi:hypothetical protein
MSFLAQLRIVFRNSFAVYAARRLTPTPCFALLTAGNQIGDAGAAALAGALEEWGRQLDALHRTDGAVSCR